MTLRRLTPRRPIRQQRKAIDMTKTRILSSRSSLTSFMLSHRSLKPIDSHLEQSPLNLFFLDYFFVLFNQELKFEPYLKMIIFDMSLPKELVCLTRIIWDEFWIFSFLQNAGWSWGCACPSPTPDEPDFLAEDVGGRDLLFTAPRIRILPRICSGIQSRELNVVECAN